MGTLKVMETDRKYKTQDLAQNLAVCSTDPQHRHHGGASHQRPNTHGQNLSSLGICFLARVILTHTEAGDLFRREREKREKRSKAKWLLRENDYFNTPYRIRVSCIVWIHIKVRIIKASYRPHRKRNPQRTQILGHL